MNCAEVQSKLSLYLYGELDFAAEDLLEGHLSECSFCQLSLDREKEWHAGLNMQQRDVRPEWLEACRSKLHAEIAGEPSSAASAYHRAADWARGLFDFRLTERSFRLAGASFLVMLGFGAGRMYHTFQAQAGEPEMNGASLLQPTLRRVQEIRPESDNRVRIIFQQVQMREVSGFRNDDGVRALLVSAAQESPDPGTRMDSVEMLAGQSSLEIRDALVGAIKHDRNAAVRMKAIELLRAFPSDAVTREALEFALAHDDDAGVRTEAMDVLAPAQGEFQVTPQLLQVMSDVIRSARDDDYVRIRCAQILNAQASAHGVY